MRALNSARLLVTGGAGYVGSHVVDALCRAGAEVVVVDNLYSGHRWAVGEATLVEGDVGNPAVLADVFDDGRFDALVHMAAHIWVGESIRNPAKYYVNNTANAARLFRAAAEHGVRAVVFSSTAAVYDPSLPSPIAEDAPLLPLSPYGRSKLMAEWTLRDIAAAHGQSTAILRYFNVAGAHDDGHLGEATPDNSHLVKVACETALGRRRGMRINGVDYPTPDGTCIRDFIHVQDLADAHVMALQLLLARTDELVLNCGYGHGFSVREVLDTFNRMTGIDLVPEIGERRPGDPPELVAANTLIREILGWEPQRNDLERIIRSAWCWEQKLHGS